jgi:hypothetical protein
MQALAGIDVVEGRPRPSAELCRALILRAGHTITVHDMSGHRCRVSGLRNGRPESERVVVEWTADMAKAAGLSSKSNWRNYPRAMLLARATSDLARLLFPDVVKGLGYIVEDAENATTLDAWGSGADESPAPVAPAIAPPQRQTRTRRPQLRDPGHAIATPDRPGPDGSFDVPLDGAHTEPVGRGEPETAAPRRDPENSGGERADAVPDVVDVDLPPEEPDDGAEPEAPPLPIRPGKLKALHTLLQIALGSSAPIEERRAFLSTILGHPVTSTKAITREEGDRALDVLAQIERGDLKLLASADGWVIGEGDTPLPDPWSEPAGNEPPLDDDPWSQLGGGAS